MAEKYEEFMKKLNSEENIKLATEYYQYMNFRAKRENLDHELDIKFYAIHLARGCPFFFGVYHNGHHITHDKQKPKFFKEWKKQ